MASPAGVSSRSMWMSARSGCGALACTATAESSSASVSARTDVQTTVEPSRIMARIMGAGQLW
jgi:hypothetical protein